MADGFMTARQRASGGERDDPSAMAPGEVLQHLLKLYNRLLVPFSLHLEKRYKISINEFRLLMLIGQMGVTASHELAELTGVNAMAVSRSVAALSRHGRIDVGVDPDNRRRKTIRLTAEGRRLFDLMQPTSDKVALFLFDALRVDEDHGVRSLSDHDHRRPGGA